ncbi:MAG TPA: hypothetical protein ENK57_00580 [Polyangiaceae bacterium]|nr:hypothetical protein [Polyangiaceae bacterium]
MANAVVLLGPQRHHPTVGSVLEDRGLRGPFALITAGWQEREPEDEELREAIGGAPAVNLGIYRRFETLATEDVELSTALHKRQERLRELQEVYRLRLGHLMAAARALFDHPGTTDLLEPERSSALETVRQLDRHHLARVEQVLRDFDEQLRPGERRAVLRQRSELAQAVHDASAVLVAGGHVATLLNRMWIFGLDEQLRHRPVVAWSAGAMAVTERVVLFHDNPPQGPGHAELLTRGIGLCRGVLALPHGSSRLRLDDPVRIAILARRFAELVPVLLDPHRRVDWDPPRWVPGPETRTLRADGAIEIWEEDEP